MPATTYGGDFLINEEISSIQQTQELVVLSGGRVLFTWVSSDSDVDPSSPGISARIGTIQPDGSVVWSAAGEVLVPERTASGQYAPEVIELADGRVLFVWHSNAGIDGDLAGVAGRVGTIQTDGSIVWGAEFTINEEVQGNQQQPQVTQLSDGRVLFAWASTDVDVDGNGFGVSVRIATVQSDGSMSWSAAGEVTVNTTSINWQWRPQVTELSDGRLVFVWDSLNSANDGDGAAIVARIGTPQADGSIAWSGGEVLVNEEIEGAQAYPQLRELPDGRVLFVWLSSDPDIDNDQGGIAARIGTVQLDGTIAWGAAGEFAVNALTVGAQIWGEVAVLDDGRIIFAWATGDAAFDGDSGGIAARIGRLQADGGITWEGPEFVVNDGAASQQWHPRMAVLADGGVVFTWQSSDWSLEGDASGAIAGRVVLFNAPALAQNDAFAISEVNTIVGGDLFANNGAGTDSDADNEPFTITAVNGSALNVGSQITLASGALLTVNANGTFDYAPNSGPEPMYQTPALDSFTYTIDDGFGGTSIATVTITLSSAGELIVGDYLGNALNGGDYGDLIVAVGGDDTVNGGDGADALDGGEGADTLNGEAGGDALYGRAGADTLNGAGGRDLLVGGDADDVLNGGADDDVLDGGADNDLLYGDDASDTLRGRAGNDVLDGGLGADFMFGGAGDDTYHVDNAGDEASEASASGSDTVIASINYVLPFYIEDLILTGGALNGAGNVLANTITGTAGANVLQGLGGSDAINAGNGADTIYGGDGLDTLNGENGNDVIDGGNFDDTLLGGDGDDILYGRQNDDTLIGEAGADTLYGGDGADDADGGDGGDLIDGSNGDDALAGGAGNDTLYGRQNNDTLNGGADDDYLYGGDGVDTLNGEAGVDALFGGNGDDRLDGGLGADILNGGAGADTFVFSTTLGGGNIDTLAAFSIVDDTIELSTAIFTGISTGALAANAFVIGSAATTADHRIIYNPTTGALLYDADGNGAGAAIRFGTLATGLALTEADFLGGP